MAWTPIVGQGMKLGPLQDFIDQMVFDRWRPNGLVLHNTGAPKLSQWHQVSGETRMRNLTTYFRDQRGWSSAPHAFVADDLVWPFTPFNRPGTHSPSWNGTKIGIEMVGDFSTEDPHSGPGLQVYRNTVALFGMLHQKLGLDPVGIKLHKEDTRTTHDCPGRKIVKGDFIQAVEEWMNHGGDYDIYQVPIVPLDQPMPRYTGTVQVPLGDVLNLREDSSASSRVLGQLQPNQVVTVLGHEMNGSTKWYRVDAYGKLGWAAARYIQVKETI